MDALDPKSDSFSWKANGNVTVCHPFRFFLLLHSSLSLSFSHPLFPRVSLFFFRPPSHFPFIYSRGIGSSNASGLMSTDNAASLWRCNLPRNFSSKFSLRTSYSAPLFSANIVWNRTSEKSWGGTRRKIVARVEIKRPIERIFRRKIDRETAREREREREREKQKERGRGWWNRLQLVDCSSPCICFFAPVLTGKSPFLPCNFCFFPPFFSSFLFNTCVQKKRRRRRKKKRAKRLSARRTSKLKVDYLLMHVVFTMTMQVSFETVHIQLLPTLNWVIAHESMQQRLNFDRNAVM